LKVAWVLTVRLSRNPNIEIRNKFESPNPKQLDLSFVF